MKKKTYLITIKENHINILLKELEAWEQRMRYPELTSEQKIEALEKQVDAIFEVLAKHGIRLDKIEPQVFPKEFCEKINK